ncbi:tetratricopeptide repeat protein [Neptuniibacter pectenicola]|jgi:tetratricopeptide (TPR) repeat protein|uniref:Tetratricopeptide repeat protein n=1 Tax=Neptuniibacter pectenicola TaxID=1806669 RepID=A0ABU9TNA1_9GAMM|nr:tetratricopeptide repeat protein [Neptuniibacter pectenicola]KXJ56056.1 MAG: hypothetical protein AXW15_07235 [Neptuniibacter sp. Phe_28]|tara:strand:- start:3296 stop:3919 length:624 start_codon:yes stop_codon:yes gene_type:complete
MKKLLITTALTLFSMCILAAPVDDARIALQTEWAQIKYETDKDQQEAMFKALAERSETTLAAFPNSAEIMIWRAIILSTYAGEKGGLGALGLVKDAKKLLETSIEIDPTALQGSAYTSLGSLYYQVPGWPIGFGSDKKAKAFLEKSLEINPDGIDSNFFNADFLIEQNKKAEAKALLEHALEAAPRPGRESADKGRRLEIQALLEKL